MTSVRSINVLRLDVGSLKPHTNRELRSVTDTLHENLFGTIPGSYDFYIVLCSILRSAHIFLSTSISSSSITIRDLNADARIAVNSNVPISEFLENWVAVHYSRNIIESSRTSQDILDCVLSLYTQPSTPTPSSLVFAGGGGGGVYEAIVDDMYRSFNDTIDRLKSQKRIPSNILKRTRTIVQTLPTFDQFIETYTKDNAVILESYVKMDALVPADMVERDNKYSIKYEFSSAKNVLTLFDDMKTSMVVPYICIIDNYFDESYHKIHAKADARFVNELEEVRPETVDVNRFIGFKVCVTDFSEFKADFDYSTVEFEDCLIVPYDEEGGETYMLVIDMLRGKGVGREENIVSSVFDTLGISSTDVINKDSEISSRTFAIPGMYINVDVLMDILMTQPEFSRRATVNEFSRISRRTNSVSFRIAVDRQFSDDDPKKPSNTTVSVKIRTVEAKKKDSEFDRRFVEGTSYSHIEFRDAFSEAEFEYAKLFVGRLVQFYMDTYPKIVDEYKTYIHGFGADIDEDRLKTDEVHERNRNEILHIGIDVHDNDDENIKRGKINPHAILGRANPKVFIGSYSRICQRPPVIVNVEEDIRTLDEVLRTKYPSERFPSGIVEYGGRQYMKYPRIDEKDDTPQHWYKCDPKFSNPNNVFPGLITNNNEKNNREFKYLPCCFSTDQSRSDKALDYFEDDESASERVSTRERKHVLMTQKFVEENELGALIPSIEKFMEHAYITHPTPLKFYRLGTNRPVLSFFDCVSRATGTDDVYSKLLDPSNARFLFSTYQTNHDLEIEEIVENLREASRSYVDPEMFIRAVEDMLDINIFIFEQIYRGSRPDSRKTEGSEDLGKDVILRTPRYVREYLSYVGERKSVCLVQHFGSESRYATYPRYELIGYVDKRESRSKILASDAKILHDEDITRVLMATFRLSSGAFGTPQHRDVVMDSAVAQDIDSIGKTRRLALRVNEKIVIVDVDRPIAPLPIPTFKHYGSLENIDPLDDTLEMLKSMFRNGAIVSNDDGKIVITANTDSRTKYTVTPLRDNEESRMRFIRRNRRVAKYMGEMTLWLLSRVYSNIPNASNVSNAQSIVDFVPEFVEEYTVVVEGYKYKIPSNDILFEYNNPGDDGSIFRSFGGKVKIVCDTPELQKRLGDYIQTYANNTPQDVVDRHKRSPIIENYYMSEEDFKTNGSLVFSSYGSAMRWNDSRVELTLHIENRPRNAIDGLYYLHLPIGNQSYKLFVRNLGTDQTDLDAKRLSETWVMSKNSANKISNKGCVIVYSSGKILEIFNPEVIEDPQYVPAYVVIVWQSNGNIRHAAAMLVRGN